MTITAVPSLSIAQLSSETPLLHGVLVERRQRDGVALDAPVTRNELNQFMVHPSSVLGQQHARAMSRLDAIGATLGFSAPSAATASLIGATPLVTATSRQTVALTGTFNAFVRTGGLSNDYRGYALSAARRGRPIAGPGAWDRRPHISADPKRASASFDLARLANGSLAVTVTVQAVMRGNDAPLGSAAYSHVSLTSETVVLTARPDGGFEGKRTNANQRWTSDNSGGRVATSNATGRSSFVAGTHVDGVEVRLGPPDANGDRTVHIGFARKVSDATGYIVDYDGVARI